MPMLVVQVDPNFVSLNLYEDNQLSFARFASIDAVDYDNSEDYVYEAVNENIYRMIQFHKSRNPENPIQNVVFYGDTTEYIRLTNALEGMDISTSLLGVPNNISGYENIEFQAYANAIGAMFRSNKDTDRINLLETDSSAGKTDAGSSFLIGLGGANLLNKAGHEVLRERSEGEMNTANRGAAQYRHYPDEPLNPRITNPVLQGNMLVATIDRVPCTIQLSQTVTDAYRAGALPLNTLANAVLARSEQLRQRASDNYDNGQQETIVRTQ